MSKKSFMITVIAAALSTSALTFAEGEKEVSVNLCGEGVKFRLLKTRTYLEGVTHALECDHSDKLILIGAEKLDNFPKLVARGEVSKKTAGSLFFSKENSKDESALFPITMNNSRAVMNHLYLEKENAKCRSNEVSLGQVSLTTSGSSYKGENVEVQIETQHLACIPATVKMYETKIISANILDITYDHRQGGEVRALLWIENEGEAQAGDGLYQFDLNLKSRTANQVGYISNTKENFPNGCGAYFKAARILKESNEVALFFASPRMVIASNLTSSTPILKEVFNGSSDGFSTCEGYTPGYQSLRNEVDLTSKFNRATKTSELFVEWLTYDEKTEQRKIVSHTYATVKF